MKLEICASALQKVSKARLSKAPRLHKAAATGDCEAILRLVHLGHPVDHLFKADGCNTALHYATIFGHCYAAYVLVRLGADIEALGQCGYTPLSIAVRTGDINTVIVLLLWGAKTDRDRFLLSSAFHSGGFKLAKILIDQNTIALRQNDKDKLLYDACLANCHDMVKTLLDLGADPNHICGSEKRLLCQLEYDRCSASVLKLIFYAQLKSCEPYTPSPIMNKQIRRRYHRKDYR